MNKVTILLVEDSPDDVELAMRALRKQNLLNDVIHAEDGVEALDFMYGRGRFQGRDLSEQPKLILLDLKLPRLDGLEVLATLKSDENLRHIPIVMLTSSREDPDIKQAYKLGANSLIVNPLIRTVFDGVADVGYYWMLINQPAIMGRHPGVNILLQ
jgi:CheY-like chemotaxis protein